MSSSAIKYFDYNATHPPIPEILEKNLSLYLKAYFNPSGASRFSLDRQSSIEEVRNYLAELTKKSKKSILYRIEDDIYCKVWTNVEYNVRNNVEYNVEYNVRNNVWKNVRKKCLGYFLNISPNTQNKYDTTKH
jgi:hypothetical protein